jgi:MoaA/NifB/PqqE/SkfB family radical SAM enzyme
MAQIQKNKHKPRNRTSSQRLSLISLHPWTGGCNLNCSFCYQNKRKGKGTKNESFWYGLVPYMKKLTNQIACGSAGEPFMNPSFISKMAELCKKEGLIFNVTSNGKKLMDMPDKRLKTTLKNITMISISFDKEKIKNTKDILDYLELVKRIKNLTNCQVGCNLLVDSKMLEKDTILKIVKLMFQSGVNRIFALCPKNITAPDILKYKDIYKVLSLKYKHFYVDDLTKNIIEENRYSNWEESCHFGKDIISIDKSGYVTGCSFDCPKKALLHLNYPKDILKIKEIKKEERFSCPYLKIPK